MINKWILNNFKSIDREKELEFRPLTIFTGANSSGKSTILQSILLVSQTLHNANASRSIVLNGWFKKFGSYTDVVNCKDISKNIKIGFSISDTDEDPDILWMHYRAHRGLFDFPLELDTHTNCDIVVSSGGKKENLLPELQSVHIETVQNGKISTMLDVEKRVSYSDTEKLVYDEYKDNFPEEELSYSIKCDDSTLCRAFDEDMITNTIGVGLNHFLPRSVIGYCHRTEHVKRMLREFLMFGHHQYYSLGEIEDKVNPVIQDKALEVVDQLYNKKLVRSRNAEKNYNAIKKKFTLNRFQTIIKNSALDEADKLKYINQVVDKVNGLFDGFVIRKNPLYHFHGIDHIQNFFKRRIKYLGPLREEPKSLYPLNNDGATTEVGLKGENTAAVYDNNKDTIVSYVEPSDFDTIRSGNLSPQNGTLSEAINKWLVYMGVADDVITDDRGKIGHSMQISNGLNIRQDLTHVGVGVSQVLPILVMSLLAKEGDVVILEQPELHLHPKVQTRLADFFVSMNALGKQCIIETHSEYMINRLRYLVATTEDSKIADDTMMYFVERDRIEGYSKYRPVAINKYGVIEEWPEGFFDESEKIAQAVLRAGMEKKMKEDNEDYEE